MIVKEAELFYLGSSLGLPEYHIPKMVGPEVEFDQLKELLHATVKGKGNTVFVSGEAWIGKTRR